VHVACESELGVAGKRCQIPADRSTLLSVISEVGMSAAALNNHSAASRQSTKYGINL
jgi:hypothetical protein